MANLIDLSQFDEYKGTVPEGMDVGSYIAGARAVFEAIGNAETVDAVQVVRCKDCERFEEMASLPHGGYCNANDQPFPADGFCSRGVRKEGP